MQINSFLAFSRLVNDFANVERITYRPGSERHENDVEHSYHLALMAWYLINSQKLDLDLGTVLKYALAHDLIEVHAGDTFIYSTDKELLRSKPEREAKAADILKGSFPEFPAVHEAIQDYVLRESREARFVYALDKVLPCLLIREDGFRTWDEHGTTLDMIVGNKGPKVALSPEVEPYFHELIRIIREERDARPIKLA
ncbi:MAG TPA: HD domain-containing protein [Candidatus Paceibacterota bacterium]